MHPYSDLSAAFLLAVSSPNQQGGPSVSVKGARQERIDSPESLRGLCHGKELCWLFILTPPRNGTFLVEAKFPEPNCFVRPEYAYCERREYWHVSGDRRTLLAADCAEKWGPDSQGPVRLSIDGAKIKLIYVEWQYDDDCEKAVAFLDVVTAKLVSFKRWSGTATRDQTDCRPRKPLERRPSGDGKTAPLVQFHSDAR